MKSRLGTASVFALVLGLLIIGPGASEASAVPLAPTVSGLDASTPGHVSGTVTTDQPFVLIRLVKSLPWTVLPVTGGHATFDLETWGLGPGQTIQAVACTESSYDVTTCSTAQTDGVQFTPTDVVPTITWPADTTIGPGQTGTITVSDPNGGGTLRAELTRFGYAPVVTPLLRNGSTKLDLAEGEGVLRVRRCATATPGLCANFSPDQMISLSVQTLVKATLVDLETMAGFSPVAHPRILTGRAGTYSVDWHLERDGVPVPGHGATVTGTLTTYGGTEPLAIEGWGLPDDEYTLVTAIVVTDPAYGTFPAATASLPVMIDLNPPQVTSINSSVGLIYPMAGDTPGHPRTTTIVAHGNFDPDDHFVVTNNAPSGSTLYQSLDTTFNPDSTELRATWNGTPEGSLGVLRGDYSVRVVDGSDNAAPAAAVVSVSNLTLMHRTYRTRFPALRRVAQHVGRCSTLRRLAPPQRSGPLGYYANTLCSRTSPRASTVSTEHRVRLPPAYRYTDVRVDIESGAARSRPSSRGLFRFRSAGGEWVFPVRMPSAYGLRTGSTHDLTGLVRPGGTVNWGVMVGARNRYVVRRFIVTVHYDVLEEPLW